jgi:hypothetical protein
VSSRLSLACPALIDPASNSLADFCFSQLRALAFQAPLFIFMFFPIAPNPDAENFNWTVLVFFVVVLWAVGYYKVWGKAKYAGPVTSVRKQDI